MKVKLLLAAIGLTLAGCATAPTQVVDQPVAVKYQYVVVKVPDEMLTVPDPGPRIDPETATDKDAALWLTYWEARYQEVEKRLRAVKTYQDRRLQELNLPADAVIKN